MTEIKRTPVRFSATGNLGEAVHLAGHQVVPWITSGNAKLVTVQTAGSRNGMKKQGIDVVVVNPMQPQLPATEVGLSLDGHAIVVPPSFIATITARDECIVLIEEFDEFTRALDVSGNGEVIVLDHRSELAYGLYHGESIHERGGNADIPSHRSTGLISENVGSVFSHPNERQALIKVQGTSAQLLAELGDVEVHVSSGTGTINIHPAPNCPARSVAISPGEPGIIEIGSRFTILSTSGAPLFGRVIEHIQTLAPLQEARRL